MVAAVRWIDRVGNGLRTAPRDASVADFASPNQSGLAFGFHPPAADTAAAMLGLLIALGVVWLAQANALELDQSTFKLIVWISILPAVLAVLALVVVARDVPVAGQRVLSCFAFR